MIYQNILHERDDHVVAITLDPPEKHNCTVPRTNAELQHAGKRFRDDADAFVAIITGTGERAFVEKNLQPAWPRHGL